MKILFVTDLYGSRWKYDRLLELAKRHQMAAVVNGGDMLPKKDSDNKEQFVGLEKINFKAGKIDESLPHVTQFSLSREVFLSSNAV